MCGHETDGAGVPEHTCNGLNPTKVEDCPACIMEWAYLTVLAEPRLSLWDDVDDEYIALCIDEMNAIAEASQELLWEAMADDWFDPESHRPREERQAEMDRRRAQLYKKHLDAAGIEIRRKGG